VLSAAILAGGGARRFDGRDKSALVVDGRPILDRQIAELVSVADDILLVGRGELPAGWPSDHRDARIRAVPDRVAGLGPLGGLDTALAEARHAILATVACDMPFVSGALLAHMAALSADVDAVVPRTHSGSHPLCAVYTRACRSAVARCLSSRRLAMKDLLDEIRVRWVTEEELDGFGNHDRLLANINTAKEYEGLRRERP